MNLYVSNLAYSLTDDELKAAFEAYGTVSSARVIMDRETGRSRGFGFVEMPNNAEASQALQLLNNQDIGGRAVKIVEARPKEERPGGGPRQFGGGGGGPRSGGGGGGQRRDFGDGGGQRRDGGGGGGGGRDRDRGWDRTKRGGGGDEDEGW